jgi:hypothetical protein
MELGGSPDAIIQQEALMQQDQSATPGGKVSPGDASPGDASPGGGSQGDASPDSEDRIGDFLARHGGPGPPRREETHPSGITGWYEVYAADGYRLRCEWSRLGTLQESKFSEIAPRTRA